MKILELLKIGDLGYNFNESRVERQSLIKFKDFFSK